MAYKWKPSASQRKEFALNMQNEEFVNALNEAQRIKDEKRRAKSQFDYNTAGGRYVPTLAQYNYAIQNVCKDEHRQAFENVCFGYSCNEKISHDDIHIVNSYIRGEITKF